MLCTTESGRAWAQTGTCARGSLLDGGKDTPHGYHSRRRKAISLPNRAAGSDRGLWALVPQKPALARLGSRRAAAGSRAAKLGLGRLSSAFFFAEPGAGRLRGHFSLVKPRAGRLDDDFSVAKRCRGRLGSDFSVAKPGAGRLGSDSSAVKPGAGRLRGDFVSRGREELTSSANFYKKYVCLVLN